MHWQKMHECRSSGAVPAIGKKSQTSFAFLEFFLLFFFHFGVAIGDTGSGSEAVGMTIGMQHGVGATLVVLGCCLEVLGTGLTGLVGDANANREGVSCYDPRIRNAPA